jgi:hypothetical protein
MLLLTSTSDLIRMVTSTTGDIDVHASWIDLASGTVSAGRTNTNVTTATTTTIVGSPAASTSRNVKTLHIQNVHASTAMTVTIQHFDGSTSIDLETVTLAAGERIAYVEGVGFRIVDVNGVPRAATTLTATNKSLTSQAFSTTDTYVTGSNVRLDGLGTPVIGLMYDCSFDMAKTAGTGAVVVTVRVGTAGTTADTARLTFTMDAGTSAADVAEFRVHAMLRSVGGGTSAVLQGRMRMSNNGQTVTGFRDASPTLGVLQVTSGGFDSTVASTQIGISFNGSTAFAGTAQLVEAELVKR